MSQPLHGKVALVTGASRGIGAAIARRLAGDGASVGLTYVSGEQKAAEVVRAIESAGGKALAIRADGADADAVRNAVRQTVQEFGALDVLVNNAGLGIIAPLDEFKLEDFDRLVAVNIRAVFVAIQEAVKHMKQGGRIITIGSCTADRMPFKGGGPYAMTKAALVGLTRGLARDLGPHGITVNNVQPGPIDTDMNPAAGPGGEAMKKATALHRYGSGDEVAAMVAYLASEEAAYVTGTSLTIDGGYTA